ncbi:MAG: sarcosine oxidase subunit delta, partial [Gammaproteobacteria bacterium]|nr:sarcosine oxidase subunit delta [Gammaproteobacteria bacterium]NIT17269.1 sarcosine oxidase subunit delta [Gammaproteobacteria bacterium]
RSNPRGAHRELWNHAQGCRRWFGVERDTVTYRISGSYRLSDATEGKDG